MHGFSSRHLTASCQWVGTSGRVSSSGIILLGHHSTRPVRVLCVIMSSSLYIIQPMTHHLPDDSNEKNDWFIKIVFFFSCSWLIILQRPLQVPRAFVRLSVLQRCVASDCTMALASLNRLLELMPLCRKMQPPEEWNSQCHKNKQKGKKLLLACGLIHSFFHGRDVFW